MYGVLLEHFAFSEKIRNERFASDEDGKGFAIGDFYFSTLIQITKNRKFPNTFFRFAAKTASGNQLGSCPLYRQSRLFLRFKFFKRFGESVEKILSARLG